MGRHRRLTLYRRKRDLRRLIREQQEYIDICDRTIASLCDENDRLREAAGLPYPGEEVTAAIPLLLEPPTHTIPIVLPDGTVLRTEQGRKRPSWAEDG